MDYITVWLGADGQALGTTSLNTDQLHHDSSDSLSREQALNITLTMLRRQHEPAHAGQVPEGCCGFFITDNTEHPLLSKS